MLTAFMRRLTVLTALVLLLPPSADAQTTDDVPQATRTFAVENARIVQAPGRVIERGTVVVRDGLIVAVGPDVAIPFEAEHIDGDTLTVYAGFVDGLSHTGVPEPDDIGESDRPERPAEPTFLQAGIQPEQNVLDVFDAEHTSVEAYRKLGFTAVHVVPRGQMLPGTGAIVLLSDGSPGAQTLRREASTFAQFEGAPGRTYPSTTMAVIARLRDLYHEASRRSQLEQRYEANPAGMERPPFDAAHAALFPVVAGERTLFFHTEDALAIHRALSLQEELGFTVALAGLQGSFHALDVLREADAPLFVSLDLPEEPDTTTVDTVASGEVTTAPDSTRVITPDQPGSYFVSDLRTHSYEDTDDELENLTARQRLEREKYYAAPAQLREAGLRFGFSTLDAEPDNIRESLRLMIEYGLSEEDALAALTIDGATLLGLDRQLGTVEAGKMANLVVTDGSYFDEDSEVIMVVVDGERYEVREKKARRSPDTNQDRSR